MSTFTTQPDKAPSLPASRWTEEHSQLAGPFKTHTVAAFVAALSPSLSWVTPAPSAFRVSGTLTPAEHMKLPGSAEQL